MPYNPHQFSTGEVITQERINSLRIPEIRPDGTNSGKVLSSNGTDFTWITPSAGGGSSRGLFFKNDSSTVVFEKTSINNAIIKAGTIIDVGGTTVTFAASAAITMPTLVAGTDYAVWVSSSGQIQASNSHTAAPGAGTWRKIGGFHYAPGGNGVVNPGANLGGTHGIGVGGNTTPQINEYSFWDLKFRPNCPDPRGMALVSNLFWCDIYLTCKNAAILGLSSVFNETIADGNADGTGFPIVPASYGGNGTTTYTGYSSWQAHQLAQHFGKRLPTLLQDSILYGLGAGATTSGFGGDPIVTGTSGGGQTSKWGIMQAHSALWTWTSFHTQTYNVIINGSYQDGNSETGRFSQLWNTDSSSYYPNVGSRFICDHFVIE